MENSKNIKPFMSMCPTVLVNEKEYEHTLVKFGSFLCLINNKNINPTFVFISLIRDENLQHIFMEITGATTLIEILQKFLLVYPNLVKSKMVKDVCIKIMKNKQRNIKRISNVKSVTKRYI